MHNKVKQTIEKYNLLDSCTHLTVALSGGADSVCLLYLMNELKDEFAFELSAIHVNHNLRGEESDRDQRFVEELCNRLGINLKVYSVDVSSRAAQEGESIELAARNLRYEIFEKNADGLVATAHNSDDNLETVILNLTRGTGVKGLAGIPIKRGIFIRPLLALTRQEIEEYLTSKNISFVTDSTNLEENYSRNRLRHRVTPVLKELNSIVENTVFNMTEDLKEDVDLIENISSKAYLLCSKSKGLDAELLKAQHIAVIKRVLSCYFKDICGISPERIHIERMLDVLNFGGKKSLPKNYYCALQNNLFVILSEEQAKNEVFFDVKIEKIEKINSLFLKNTIDYDKISGKLVVRTRLSGDKIKPNGRNCTKSLKKIYNEIKLETNIRDYVPVIVDNIGVVWAYGVGVDSRVAANENTKNAAQIYVTETEHTNSMKGSAKLEKEFA